MSLLELSGSHLGLMEQVWRGGGARQRGKKKNHMLFLKGIFE